MKLCITHRAKLNNVRVFSGIPFSGEFSLIIKRGGSNRTTADDARCLHINHSPLLIGIRPVKGPNAKRSDRYGPIEIPLPQCDWFSFIAANKFTPQLPAVLLFSSRRFVYIGAYIHLEIAIKKSFFARGQWITLAWARYSGKCISPRLTVSGLLPPSTVIFRHCLEKWLLRPLRSSTEPCLYCQ